MNVKDLPDWDAFGNEIAALREKYNNPGSPLLYRGQPNSEFLLKTTLERAGRERMLFNDYYLLVTRTRPAVETFTGVKWEVPDYSAEISRMFGDKELFAVLPYRFPSLELYRYLVYLRHHGFPSPLLDWSHSPYVAAFFAFQDLARKPNSGEPAKRSIYVYCEFPTGSKSFTSGAPAMRPLGAYVRSHPRHFRQQSNYTICYQYDESGSSWRFCPHELAFGARGDKQDALWKFNLPSSEWKKVMNILNDYNLNSFSLFDSEEALLETMWFREHVMRQRE